MQRLGPGSRRRQCGNAHQLRSGRPESPIATMWRRGQAGPGAERTMIFSEEGGALLRRTISAGLSSACSARWDRGAVHRPRLPAHVQQRRGRDRHPLDHRPRHPGHDRALLPRRRQGRRHPATSYAWSSALPLPDVADRHQLPRDPPPPTGPKSASALTVRGGGLEPHFLRNQILRLGRTWANQ
jgi:hypothetical protein